jgi:hypothetical protein
MVERLRPDDIDAIALAFNVPDPVASNQTRSGVRVERIVSEADLVPNLQVNCVGQHTEFVGEVATYRTLYENKDDQFLWGHKVKGRSIERMRNGDSGSSCLFGSSLVGMAVASTVDDEWFYVAPVEDCAQLVKDLDLDV